MKVRHNRSGFSLIELVIVVVIIGIIAAIAIPRLSRGSAGAGDSAVSGDLAVLRSAIDLYATEHSGTYPTATNFASQMTEYTDANGSFATAKTSTIIYGPYLRTIPTLPVGTTNKGQTGIADATSATQGVAGSGWFYNDTTGAIDTNCSSLELDATSKAYNTY